MTCLKSGLTIWCYSIVLALVSIGCGNNVATNENETEIVENNNQNQSSLRLEANGEDFVREGFVTKDGWQIDFNHVYVTLTDVVAYQTNPPFDVDQESPLSAVETVNLVEKATTIDLAQENPNPVVVNEIEANPGIYNALSWQVSPDGPENASIVLEGVAKKDNQSVEFLISFEETLNYVCGEFVGDERKGVATVESPGVVETTFHFDHIFGDAETPMSEALNQDALGFQPLANLSENGQLKLNMAMLKQQLEPQDYSKLEKAIVSLGHVGEGHCKIDNESLATN